jgi:hypothetical protein
VIEDADDRVVGFLAEDTEVAYPMLADGRGLREVPLEERWSHPRQAMRRPWVRSDLVMIFPRDRRYSLWVFHEGGEHVGWYINLEQPHVFGERTIITRDDILDIWVPAETSEPQWKDEDEFEVAQQVGRLTEEDAAAILAEGQRVMVERPWPTGWENWRPPADWGPARLPDDWRDPS